MIDDRRVWSWLIIATAIGGLLYFLAPALTPFALSALFAFYSTRLAWQSRQFNDISTSNDATPLWIPQLAMAAGSLILLVAFVDEWVLEMRGQRQAPSGSDEPLRNE